MEFHRQQKELENQRKRGGGAGPSRIDLSLPEQPLPPTHNPARRRSRDQGSADPSIMVHANPHVKVTDGGYANNNQRNPNHIPSNALLQDLYGPHAAAIVPAG